MKNIKYVFLVFLFVGCTISEVGVVPLAPSELKATIVSSDQVDLSWTDNSTNETEYRIERKTETGNFIEIGTADIDVTTFSDKSLSINTNYTYRIYCLNQVGKSISYSNEVTIKTFNLPFKTVIGANGRIWMDRNLGASRVATSSTDAESYGDLYQWGRGADGHQKRTSTTTTLRSSTDVPGNGNFILVSVSPFDWRNPQNVNLWQGINGINNPCPSGYRIPTEEEWETERKSWSSNTSAGAFASPLKLPNSGARNGEDGSLFAAGNFGHYWSSTLSGTGSKILVFSASLQLAESRRVNGRAVRCIKN